jgi:DNA-directed RNA polymerase specialized sigma subunit
MSKLKQWQAELTRESNRTKDEALMGILAKIEVYAIRFAICLEVLKHGTTTSPLESISLESVNGAIKLAEYFKENALKVQQLVSKRGLPGIKETILLLNSLNHSQSEIARILKISQPYVSRIINQSA